MGDMHVHHLGQRDGSTHTGASGQESAGLEVLTAHVEHVSLWGDHHGHEHAYWADTTVAGEPLENLVHDDLILTVLNSPNRRGPATHASP